MNLGRQVDGERYPHRDETLAIMVISTNCLVTRTRQIIRYRATATLRRPQNKQYSAQNWGVQNKQEHHIILTKYEAVHPIIVVNVCSDSHKALQSFVKRSNKASSRIYYDSLIHIKI